MALPHKCDAESGSSSSSNDSNEKNQQQQQQQQQQQHHAKPSCCSHNKKQETIITVEEFERRKERFRKATKEYYEQAETNFRSLYGFCNPPNTDSVGSKRKRRPDKTSFSIPSNAKKFGNNEEKASTTRLSRSNSRPMTLKRCRRRRSRITNTLSSEMSSMSLSSLYCSTRPINELEAELARCLLISSLRIVELAMEEYLVSIKGLIRCIPQWWQQQPHPQHSSHQQSHHYPHENPIYVTHHLLSGGGVGTSVLVEDEEFLLTSPLPLPLLFDKHRTGESLIRRLHRHSSELAEEKDTAMASLMIASRETKLTEELSQKIRSGIDSIQIGLHKILALVEANGNSTYYCCHYDTIDHIPPPRSIPAAATATSTPSKNNNNTNDDDDTTEPETVSCASVGGEGPNPEGASCWQRSVVEALKLDGHYRWFRANNGVLLIGKNNQQDSGGGESLRKNGSGHEWQTGTATHNLHHDDDHHHGDRNRLPKKCRKEISDTSTTIESVRT